jgi:uncharacterized protein YjbI with pentapeptide repeats
VPVTESLSELLVWAGRHDLHEAIHRALDLLAAMSGLRQRELCSGAAGAQHRFLYDSASLQLVLGGQHLRRVESGRRRGVALRGVGAIVLATVLLGFAVPLTASAADSRRALAGDTPAPVVNRRAHALRRHPAGATLQLNVGLAARNQPQLEAVIRAASSPGSARYGHYLTNAQYLAEYAPTKAEVDALERWLRASGLSVRGASKDRSIVDVQGATSTVEQAFGVAVDDYELAGRTFHSNDRPPTVPSSLRIDGVSGLSDYDQPHVYADTNCFTDAWESVCGYTGNGFRAAYDASGSGSGETIGFTLWGRPESQATYTKYGEETGTTPLTVGGSGEDGLEFIENGEPDTSRRDQGEIALDTEVAHAVAPGIHETYWLASEETIGATEQMIDEAANSSISIISNSWGLGTCESDPVIEGALEHGAATGKTFYFSTGDEPAKQGCHYPAMSPYVVAVGGTELHANQETGAWTSESATGDTGGCSNAVPRPWWQSGVQGALEWPSTPCSGRAIPDVSADSCAYDENNAFFPQGFEGSNCLGWVVIEDQSTLVGGTSMAAPIWAATAALWENANAAAGRPELGFSAPLLYRLANDPTTYARDFHDITTGTNSFEAHAGWDEATGWGSPDIDNLIASSPSQNCPAAPGAEAAAGVNWSGCDLRNADLRGADLEDADLKGADLEAADLHGANLQGTQIAVAQLAGVSSGAIAGSPASLPGDFELVGGYLVGPQASLLDAALGGEDLRNADLEGAEIAGATFAGAQLAGVRSGSLAGAPVGLPADWQLLDGYLVGPGAQLTNAELRGANLDDADLEGATLTRADLEEARLYGALMRGVRSGSVQGAPVSLPAKWGLLNGYLVGPGADLQYARLGWVGVGVDLQGADLERAFLEYAPEADLEGANLTHANLLGAELQRADLEHATLVEARGILMNLEDADLQEVDARKAHLGHADLEGANFDGADLLDAELSPEQTGGSTWHGATCPDGRPSTAHEWETCPDELQQGPLARIESPAGGGSYLLGETVSTSFVCEENWEQGLAIESCLDSNGYEGGKGFFEPGHGYLNTNTTGPHEYRVTATRTDGAQATATISYTVVKRPSVEIALTPETEVEGAGGGEVLRIGSHASTTFRCTAGEYATLESCVDSNGASGGHGEIDTSAPGQFTYTVIAKDTDGHLTVGRLSYTVAEPPRARISSPASGATYALGQQVQAQYACTEGADGPGISRCFVVGGESSNQGLLNTSTAGAHEYRVYAISSDGLEASARITYSVTGGGPKAVIGSPSDGVVAARGEVLPTSFSCLPGELEAPVSSCEDSNGASGGVGYLATTAEGAHEYSVTALDGAQSATSRIQYSVIAGPEFGRCVKLSARTGAYSSATCTTAGVGKDEWTPGWLEGGITFAGSRATLDVAPKVKITCTGVQGSGALSTPKAFRATLTLTGCALKSVPCASASTAGAITSAPLDGQLQWVSHGEGATLLELSAHTPGTPLLSFTCATTSGSIGGPLLAGFTDTKMTSDPGIKLKAPGGIQSPQQYEAPDGESATAVPVATFAGVSRAAGVAANVSVRFEEPLEAKGSR